MIPIAIFTGLNRLSFFLFTLLLLTGSILLSACNKNEEREPPETSGSGVRLKHLATAQQIAVLLDETMQGYTLQGTGGFTNMGYYPKVLTLNPHP